MPVAVLAHTYRRDEFTYVHESFEFDGSLCSGVQNSSITQTAMFNMYITCCVLRIYSCTKVVQLYGIA